MRWEKVLGIGLRIGYGMLIVNRFREERRRGNDVHEAVVATAGPTVWCLGGVPHTVDMLPKAPLCALGRLSP